MTKSRLEDALEKALTSREGAPSTRAHGDWTMTSKPVRDSYTAGHRQVGSVDKIHATIKHKDGKIGADVLFQRDRENGNKTWDFSVKPHEGTKPNMIGAGPWKAFAEHMKSSHEELGTVNFGGRRRSGAQAGKFVHREDTQFGRT